VDTTIEQIADKAVVWWMNVLTDGFKYDIGASSEPAGSPAINAEFMAETLRDNPQKDKLEKFAKLMKEHILTSEDNIGYHVDYHPEGDLGNMAAEAGLGGFGTFPAKTFMGINKETMDVVVKYGYGADFETL